MNDIEIRRNVREGYAKIANNEGSCCGPSCCGGGDSSQAGLSRNIGYSEEEIKSVREGANLGLGCGNPLAFASIAEGDVVLDLGSGAGFDCFLASERVGPSGRVIGVDMTPDMIEKARTNALKGNYTNVEFRLGEIENLPVADASVDAVVSNCVINLSTDKDRVFAEAFRALKPGGTMLVSDIVLSAGLPEDIRNSVSAYVGCIAGALPREEYLAAIRRAGFRDIEILEETDFNFDSMVSEPTAQAFAAEFPLQKETLIRTADAVLSIRVSARK